MPSSTRQLVGGRTPPVLGPKRQPVKSLPLNIGTKPSFFSSAVRAVGSSAATNRSGTSRLVHIAVDPFLRGRVRRPITHCRHVDCNHPCGPVFRPSPPLRGRGEKEKSRAFLRNGSDRMMG